MEIIHIVLGKANPDRMNGVNKMVYQLATNQVKSNLDVSVWGITKDISTNYGERNFKTELFSKPFNPFAISVDLEIAILSKKGNAIFHLHGGWIPAFFSLSALFHKNKIPFVITPHGAYNQIAMKRSRWIKKIYYQLFEKKCLKKASKIHCIGKSEAKGTHNLFQNNKTILLPYGYVNDHNPSAQIIKNKKIIFGFIGRLDIYTKGLDTLVDAFAAFIKEHPQSLLWIVGDSKERNELELVINQKKITDTVVLLGSKFGVEKETILNQIDVFVHPSRNEGLPLSVIEAASFGKPCIVTEATNIGHLITEYDAGITINEQNTTLLLNAMKSMYATWNNNDAFGIMQQNAIKMVTEEYNWPTIIQQYNSDLYQLK